MVSRLLPQRLHQYTVTKSHLSNRKWIAGFCWGHRFRKSVTLRHRREAVVIIITSTNFSAPTLVHTYNHLT